MDELLTTKEVAKILKVNPWQVLDYIYQKKLKAQKMGNGIGKKGNKRRWRIWKQDLLDFINKGSNIKDSE